MNRIRLICLSLALAGGAEGTASAEPFSTGINPALRYYQAFIVAPDLAPEERDFLFSKEWRGEKLPERFGELVARYDTEFRLVREAAKATVPCDWGLDLGQGPYTLLPHLARNKGIAQAARLRVMWDLQQGRQADACADLLGALALARNSSRDGLALAVLVQINTESMICSTIAENFHQFSPESLKQLADGFNPASPRGTFAGTLAMEKTSFVDWLLGRIAKFQKENPGNDAKVMAGIQELIVGIDRPPKTKKKNPPPSLWEQVNKAAGGSSQGIVQLLHDEEPLFQRMAAIMALPPAEYADKIEAFTVEVQGSTNPLVTMTFPSLEKVRPREFGTLTELAMVRAAVEYKLHGERGLKSVTDPCGDGPFAMERFVFEGVDRGFELKSAYDGLEFPEALIFTEKDGPPFQVNGRRVGQRPMTAAIKQ